MFKGCIANVLPESIAAEVGLAPGDKILAVNNKTVKDIIDLSFLLADENIELLAEKANGVQEIIEIEKDYDEDLGIEFESAVFDGVKSCANRCIFCFVDQIPPGMRETLYIKDDDYRLSFLYGNFITLTNIAEEDLKRIRQLNLSPLYVSVHTTNSKLRVKMLNNKNSGDILAKLQELIQLGVEIHTQIVLCPGYNDQAELLKTISDLAALRPGVLSAGVVPVGLTRFRENCHPLNKFTAEQAAKVIDELSSLQAKFRQESGSSFVYPADELYLLAGRDIPAYEWYDEFPQLENGIGLVRAFITEWEETAIDCSGYEEKVNIDIVCGQSVAEIFSQLVSTLTIRNLAVRIVPVENRFFGECVTVTGLLTGRDIIAAIAGWKDSNRTGVILSGVALRKSDGKFLDNITPQEVAKVAGVPVKVADSAAEVKSLLENFR